MIAEGLERVKRQIQWPDLAPRVATSAWKKGGRCLFPSQEGRAGRCRRPRARGARLRADAAGRGEARRGAHRRKRRALVFGTRVGARGARPRRLAAAPFAARAPRRCLSAAAGKMGRGRGAPSPKTPRAEALSGAASGGAVAHRRRRGSRAPAYSLRPCFCLICSSTRLYSTSQVWVPSSRFLIFCRTSRSSSSSTAMCLRKISFILRRRSGSSA